MPKPIYKYVGPEFIDKVFSAADKVTLKCSYPKDFNDPYELFLTTDYDLDSEALAIYGEAVGDLPQLPTTCFSRSPIVIPMWAHYAQNHQGFVLEFDEDELEATVQKARFKDVDYSDKPTHDFTDLIRRIQVIGKPRYTYFLQTSVMNAAYFTKTLCWSYEQERRMVVSPDATREVGDLLLLDVPGSAISKIICGARASDDTKAKLQAIAEEHGCEYFELYIGKSTATPFLVQDGVSYRFNGLEISETEFSCGECLEPVKGEEEICSWCGITDDLRNYAASRNAFRILDRVGHLESYIKAMNGVRGQASDKEE